MGKYENKHKYTNNAKNTQIIYEEKWLNLFVFCVYRYIYILL